MHSASVISQQTAFEPIPHRTVGGIGGLALGSGGGQQSLGQLPAASADTHAFPRIGVPFGLTRVYGQQQGQNPLLREFPPLQLG